MTPQPEASAAAPAAPPRSAHAPGDGDSVVPGRADSCDAPAGPARADTVSDGLAPGTGDAPKYEFDSMIAEGAEGRVYMVRDRDLARRVAMKVMRPGTADDMRKLQRFLNEARRTASLEHAGIPAIHDLGYVATGEMFFTMRLVEGRTLREVFESLTRTDGDAQREWTMVRLVQVIQQVAAAMDFAHCQGVIHRDLKPENIAVSDYHEVLVLDWGLSKRIGRDPDAPHAPAESSAFATQLGAVKGTPLYMAPEQARGAVDQLDARADVFSMGAILYEALCHDPPYDGATVREIVDNARAGKIVPISQRPGGRDLPRALVDTCMRALSADREARHASANEFAEDLQAFLEGTKEREMRAREASSLVESATRLLQRAQSLAEEGAKMERLAADLRRTLPPWAPESEKARLWSLEDGASRSRVEAADTHARAADLASRALALEADHVEARRMLAQVYFDRFAEAELQSNAEEAAWLRRMVERFDDGAFAERMRDRAWVSVESDPVGGACELARVSERQRRRVEVERRPLGTAPVTKAETVPGDYVLHVTHPAAEPARIPVRLARGERREIVARLARKGTVPAGFVWVAPGPFACGHGNESAVVHVDGFAIMERPVLLREYALWLDELARSDVDAASEHLPWVETHGALLRIVDGSHVFCAASPLSRKPIAEHPDLPAVGIPRTSAAAYAAWLGARIGADLRLPTEQQWEKAARGVDGRLYPWGDHFDASFCSMIESTPGESALRPAGAFAADVSPYGVRDMAGGVREWCRDDAAEGGQLGVCRGGAWYLRGRECTVTSRWIVESDLRNPGIGFRLCCEIPSA